MHHHVSHSMELNNLSLSICALLNFKTFLSSWMSCLMCSRPQLLQFWDAEWGVAKLLRYVRELLIEPNLALLPPDYAEGTRHDPALHSHHRAHAHAGDEDWVPQFEEGPVVGPPAGDLRRRKGRNRFLAELVYLFCEHRDRYDATARDFSRRYAQLPPPPPGYTPGCY